ncbi:MFS transporter small subunit [Cellulomonas phragmiteti]|uniref:Uncharacterized protein n=1 Tax=Cellulomonas phragmiteti TaxID=478780 RepID=A0ABQ4DM89_9CELL|nr:hypothetical protein [Cellulomonas phragmiteti]GIG40473.1 hypothetical protein Cph01nite_22350 [Cellulomonas phragmiteti]
MTSDQPLDANDTAALTEPAAGGSAPVRALAIALWVVVGSLLAYGIAQTVIKASALFA